MRAKPDHEADGARRPLALRRVTPPNGATWAVAALCVALAATGVTAGELRALPEGQRPRDVRLGTLRTLNDDFPFTRVDSPAAWSARAAALRARIRVANGLWPAPTRTPLNAVIHGTVDRPEYTVEKVYFESLPGHFVTGNLYHPRGEAGPRCAVLSPHGHTGSDADRRAGGRVHDHGAAGVRREIAAGAERFEAGGRHPLQARAVQLARMGCVVFQYDMVGYADSLQLPHTGLGVREAMNTETRWGFSSPQAELHLQSLMGLQTWNSVRALDFLLSLPDIDPQRVAVEGHSGGATQVFTLAGIDERPSVLFAAVMVSTGMQGGCLCENACYLRIGAGNVDFAGLAAPRPLGMTGADDWTIEIETRGLPDLKRLYGLVARDDLVDARAFPQFGHNYNSVSRTVMYDWLNHHLGLGFEEPVLELDYEPLSREEASAWSADHPAPHGDQVGESHERDVLEWMTRDARAQLERLEPKDADGFSELRSVLGGAYDVILGRRLEDVGGVELERAVTHERDGYRQTVGVLRNPERGEELPVVLLDPAGEPRGVVIWLHEQGKDGLIESSGEPAAPIRQLLRAGQRVVGIDLLFQGEYRSAAEAEAPDEPLRGRLLQRGDGSMPWQRAAVFTFGYSPPLFAQRVHDVLTAVSHARSAQPQTRVALVGLGPVAGPLAAAAKAQAGEAIARVAIDTGGFRFAALRRFDSPMFLPGAAKYLDLPGLLALSADAGQLWLTGEGAAAPHLVRRAYESVGGTTRLAVYDGAEPGAQLAAWLVADLR